MVSVEKIKCPNCGGSVPQTGFVTCPYCGSALTVLVPGSGGFPGQERRFRHWPDQVVTRDTRDIPFRPTVSYDALPGGTPQGPSRADAEAIIELVRRTHEAVNREDLGTYMSTLDPEAKAFYAQAQTGATEQFVETDMKRYTVAIVFTLLSADRANYDVTIEALIFLPTGQVNNIGATFEIEARKTVAGWKDVSSRVKDVDLNPTA